MDAITIILPLPSRTTHPNARGHWAVKARATKQQRQDAYYAALAALDCREPPRWKHATIHAAFYKPNGRVLGDADNCVAWLKASADGIADAGILDNDRGLVWLAPTQIVGKTAGEPRVVVTIKGIGGERTMGGTAEADSGQPDG
jgi:crossover junction endodeoxyribonuclease RusA